MKTLKIYILPVVVSVVATWLAGFLWFRILFRLPENSELTKPAVSLLQHIGDIGFACLIAWIMFSTDMHTILEAIALAAMIWFGYVLAVAGHVFAFQSFNSRFFFITTGSVLFSLLITGIILGAIIKADWVKPLMMSVEQAIVHFA